MRRIFLHFHFLLKSFFSHFKYWIYSGVPFNILPLISQKATQEIKTRRLIFIKLNFLSFENLWNFNFHTQNWNLRAMSGSFSTVFPPLKNKDNSKHRLANKFYQPFLLTWIKVMEKPPAHFLTHLSLKAFHFLNVENWGNIFSFSRALEIKKLKKWSTTKITGKIQRIFMVEMINWGLSVNDVLFIITQILCTVTFE